jgi:hypothetical protein
MKGPIGTLAALWVLALGCLSMLALAMAPAIAAPSDTMSAAENYESWPVLRPTFPSTGGGGFMIKGYDPVITGKKCVTTFMAVEPGENPNVHANIAEFDAVPVAGGTLCQNGRWRAFEGGATGTTPFRVFFKDGVFRAAPLRGALFDGLDDAEIALAGVVENFERCLVAGAVVAFDRGLDAREFDDDHALLRSSFEGDGGIAARQKLAAGSLDRRSGELGILGHRIGIGDRTIHRYPVRLRHVRLRRLFAPCSAWSECPPSTADLKFLHRL